MPTKIELCSASEVDVGAVLKVEKDDLTLAVFNLDGEFFVTDDHCTHGPGSLSEGFVEVTSSSAIFTAGSSISGPARSSGRRAWFRSRPIPRWSKTGRSSSRCELSLRPHPEEARSAVSKDEGGLMLRDGRLRRPP